MGYYSQFSGALTPDKPIPAELSYRINNAGIDVRVADAVSADDSDGEPGDIVPFTREMCGYHIARDIVRVQGLLDTAGIKLNGIISRDGESSDDFEQFEVVNGKVFVRMGEVRYGKRRQITKAQVDKFAVAVFKASKSNKGDPWVFLGWLRYSLGNYRVEYSEDGGDNFNKKPPMWAEITGRKAADEAGLSYMAKHQKQVLMYKVKRIEDKL